MPTFKSGEMTVQRGTLILNEGTVTPFLFTVLEGCALRFMTLEDGRQQVIGFVFPGDFIGLQSAMLSEMHHSVQAATPMRLCVFDKTDFRRLYETCSQRAFDVTWLAAREEHFLGNHLMTVGRRSAVERVAFGLWTLHRRAHDVGLASKTAMDMPFTQQNLADALGLSLVHTNKMLRQLARRRIASWAARRLTLLDPERLRRLALVEEEGESPKRPLI